MNTERKQQAIKRLAVETVLSIAKVHQQYPGWVGMAMAYRIAMCASGQARAIAAYTEPKEGEVIAVVEPRTS